MDVRHLNQHQLAKRWAMSPRTLEKWRWLEHGPSFLKVGGHVVYRLEDIEEYERSHRREHFEPPLTGRRLRDG